MDPQTEPPTACCSPIDKDGDIFMRKRIALLGSRCVGKSALASRCALGHFTNEYTPTFEDMYLWRTKIDEVPYEVMIIDTDAQDGHSLFGPHFTVGIDGYILVYSVRSLTSFQLIKRINESLMTILNVIKPKGCEEVPRILIGNQCDILDDRRVPHDLAAAYAADINIPYFETSAATGINVCDSFAEILRIIDYNWRYRYLLPENESNINCVSIESDEMLHPTSVASKNGDTENTCKSSSKCGANKSTPSSSTQLRNTIDVRPFATEGSISPRDNSCAPSVTAAMKKLDAPARLAVSADDSLHPPSNSCHLQ